MKIWPLCQKIIVTCLYRARPIEDSAYAAQGRKRDRGNLLRCAEINMVVIGAGLRAALCDLSAPSCVRLRHAIYTFNEIVAIRQEKEGELN